jgi:hypothetical protein
MNDFGIKILISTNPLDYLSKNVGNGKTTPTGQACDTLRSGTHQLVALWSGVGGGGEVGRFIKDATSKSANLETA